MKNKRNHIVKLLIIAFTCALFACGNKEKTVTLELLLDEMVSFDDAAIFPDYTCHQMSSYDRRSVSPGNPEWFANNDGFGIIRVDSIGNRIENVLFDEKGPGVITRIWITTLNKKGTVRFYFDGNTEPGWTIPAYDMMKFGLPLEKGLLQAHTSYVEGGKGGSTLFLPIPYAQSCKITFEELEGEKPTPKYYHINFRRYPAGTAVETFSEKVAKRAEANIKETDRLLQNPPTFTDGENITKSAVIGKEQSVVLEMPSGENAVRTIQFNITVHKNNYEQTMRELIVQAEFDGVETVWAPLGDFSGAGMGAPEVKSWYLDADGNGNITSRWVMPYKEKAKITLTNYSSTEVSATVSANTAPFAWNNKTMYFHAAWRQERAIPLTEKTEECIDWNFITLQGRGIYRGDVLSLFNHAPAWYGEGDEKIWVDDDTFPSHFGTGTEDYYNSSWAPVIPFQTPFGGAPRADLESSHAYNTFFRTRNLDGIPFQKQFRFDIEMLSWVKGTADYSTTVYWYGDLDSKAIGTSGLEEAQVQLLPAPPDPAKFQVEGAIEFEKIQPVDKTASISADEQNMMGFTGGEWSQGKHLLCVGGRTGDHMTFRFPDLDNNKKYQLVLYATKAADYGIIAFNVNGKDTQKELDCYNNEVATTSVDLGIYSPKDNHIDLKITIKGTNPNSVGDRYFVGLDCIKLTEK